MFRGIECYPVRTEVTHSSELFIPLLLSSFLSCLLFSLPLLHLPLLLSPLFSALFLSSSLLIPHFPPIAPIYPPPPPPPPGESSWLMVATGVADCYYNVVDLPAGVSFRFRVACVNKAGQGPYSRLSEAVCLDSTGPLSSASALSTQSIALWFHAVVVGQNAKCKVLRGPPQVLTTPS